MAVPSLELLLLPGASIRGLIAELRRRHIQVEGLESRQLDDGTERLLVDIRGPASLDVDSILSDVSQLPDVVRVDLALLHSPDVVADDSASADLGGRFGMLRRSRSSASVRSAVGDETEDW